jgi:hypothetical protein
MNNMMKTIYHIKEGESHLYQVDATAAVNNHPEEWSNEPWPKSEPAAAAPAEKPVLKMPEPAAAAKT